MGVGVMLDLARVIVDRNEPFDNSLIFSEFCECDSTDDSVERWRRYGRRELHAKSETLQDGSHLYSTQHPSAKR